MYKCIYCGAGLTTGDADLMCTSCRMKRQLSGEIPYLYGWICPRCQKIHSPFSLTCDCPPPYIVSTGSTTELKQ